MDFGQPIGSEPGFQRPAVIVSSDRFNRSRINTVIVTAVTTNARLAAMPGNVQLEASVAGLPKDCVVNVSQTLVVDRVRLTERIGSLQATHMSRVSNGLRLVLAL